MYASIPQFYRVLLILLLVSSLAFLIPLATVEARGGFSPLSFIISIVSSVALAAIGVPPIWSFLSEVGNVGLGVAVQGVLDNLSLTFLSTLTDAAVEATIGGAILGGIVSNIGTGLVSCVAGGCDTSPGDAAPRGYNVFVTLSDLSQIEVGGGANLSGTITNNGPEPIVGSFTSRFQIFPTSQILDNSQDLAQANPLTATVASGLSVGESVVVTAYWDVPADFNPGQYFLRLCANVDGGASESNSGNNCGELQAFTVVNPPESGYAPESDIAYTGFRLSEQVVGAVAEGLKGLVAVVNAATGGDLTSGVPSIYPAPKRVPQVVLCPFGYYFVEGVHYCIPEGYSSCGYVGYPDRICPTGSFCRTDGQCESGTAGQNCQAGYNQVCQSAANSCGMTSTGFGSCSGVCQSVAPAESLCAVPKIELTTEPRLINFKTSCKISWVLSDYQKCTLTGPGVSEVIYKDRPKGSVRTPPIEFTSTYTMACINGTVVRAEKSADCVLNPRFQEI